MICTNNFKHCYYPIVIDIIIDYKEQVFITGIKANVQYFVYHIFLLEQENLTKI